MRYKKLHATCLTLRTRRLLRLTAAACTEAESCAGEGRGEVRKWGWDAVRCCGTKRRIAIRCEPDS